MANQATKSLPDNNSQGRKWQLTQNNPDLHGCTNDYVMDCMKMLNADYFCMADEIGENKTYHKHIYIYREPSIRFKQLKTLFPTAHIERAYGTHKENRDYIRKEGIYEKTTKASTNLKDTFYENTTLPEEASQRIDKQSLLITMIEEGLTNSEIVKRYPAFSFRLNQIDQLRETLFTERYSKEMRDVFVTFVTGSTGLGKTYKIQEEYGFENVCRVTTYPSSGKAFDAYNFHDVLVFEEYASQIPITDMLNILDNYPLKLPARFYDRTAAYTKVFITSNLDLYDLYPNIQQEHPETWRAFLRRIDKVRKYTAYREYKEVDVNEVINPYDKTFVNSGIHEMAKEVITPDDSNYVSF